VQFYRAEPTANTSWRLAILMGANSRTYKFALGSALLSVAKDGREAVSLAELAKPYALALARRAKRYPQGPAQAALGETDYLSILKAESEATLSSGSATERLISASVATMPGMVMQKFHNLRAFGEIPHRFYEVTGRGKDQVVQLTPELTQVAQKSALLQEELDARWSIVEISFDVGIGRSLMDRGVVLSTDGDQILQAPFGRTSVTSARAALSGFQHGRCFYCNEPLTSLPRAVHVDHFYPIALTRTGSWKGPDVNGIWNLVVACSACNLNKSTRLPTQDEVRSLIDRNEAVMTSPHPLKRTLEMTMSMPNGPSAVSPAARLAFIQAVDNLATG
jgi:5-methylcytosine-specific restriction endonuclease McrA